MWDCCSDFCIWRLCSDLCLKIGLTITFGLNELGLWGSNTTKLRFFQNNFIFWKKLFSFFFYVKPEICSLSHSCWSLVASCIHWKQELPCPRCFQQSELPGFLGSFVMFRVVHKSMGPDEVHPSAILLSQPPCESNSGAQGFLSPRPLNTRNGRRFTQ